MKLVDFWREYHRDYESFLVYCIKGSMTSIRLPPGDADPNHLAKMVSARSFHFKMTIFPFVTNIYPGGGDWSLGKYCVSPQSFAPEF